MGRAKRTRAPRAARLSRARQQGAEGGGAVVSDGERGGVGAHELGEEQRRGEQQLGAAQEARDEEEAG